VTLSTFPTFLTFLTFGLVRAGWLRLVTTKMDGRAIHRWRINPLLFSGHQCQKDQKGQKGVPVMTPSTFPTFLTFLAQSLRLPALGRNSCEGLGGHESLGLLTTITADKKALQ
jgi:hypothetical protein